GVRHERIFPEPETASSKNLYSPDLCIVSTGLCAHKQRRQDLDAARRFDIALVDEAHYARRQNPAAAENRRADPRFGRLYTTIRDGLRKRSESLWLATATPMQLDWIEVYDLIHLTNRVGAFQNDPTLTWGYYDLLGRLVRGQPVSQQEWEFLRQVVRSIEYHDPFLKQYIDTAVIDGRIRGAARQLLEQGRIPRGRDLVNIRRLIFSAAPLSRVMLRHTRSLLEIYKERGQLQARLARRTIHPIPRIVFTALEQKAYDLLINFDLPWNPMKVEQRIGRIDRIGQKYDDIYVLNLCYVGSVEETVYGRLLQRLAQAGGVVGTQQVSMLPVSEDDFQKLAMGELSEEELEQLALERIECQQERTASMEIPATDLYDIYMRMAQEHAGQKLPVTLGMIWDVLCTSEYLHRVGCTVSQNGRIMTVNGIQGVPDNTLLTADRELFDKGLPGEDRPLHFSSWGDPVFDAILVEIEQYGLPECVSRIRTKISGLQAEMVAYAVVTTGEDGKSEVQLVISLEQAATETLNLETKIDEPRLAGEKQRLQNIAHKEFSSVQAAAAIERDNIQSACSQHLLSLVTMFALLNNFDVSEQENFRATVKILDKSIDKKTTLGLHNLWADPLRPFAGSFLFDVKIPQIGEQASVQAPHLLALSAVDTGYRVAHSMRKKMSELTVGNVLDRLEREIQRVKCNR
ncbi:MAG: hypothetical protein GQ559_00145, partial [Desulfobulbaceae bacterium]|nr:hypothetical protein [Desulfobulbaceae bacterium]